jgi:predicted metal-binding protein
MNAPPLLYVCVTCPRGTTSLVDGQRGRDLADAARRYARDRGLTNSVRSVECLMGCPTPCNAALRTPGKATLRFAGLGREDLPALFEVATRYAECEKGDIQQDQLPFGLRRKLAAKVMPIEVLAKIPKESV